MTANKALSLMLVASLWQRERKYDEKQYGKAYNRAGSCTHQALFSQQMETNACCASGGRTCYF
jgi:hypothetical protein